MTSAGRSLLFFVFAGGAVVACGGAPNAQAPRSSFDAEPMTVEEAQAQIARAEAALGGGGGPGAASDAAPPPPPPATPTATPPSVSTASPFKPDAPSAETKKTAPSSSAAPDQCSDPCRALASMRRAVTALCRMTGDDDGRCRDARKTLQSSEARVTPCSC